MDAEGTSHHLPEKKVLQIRTEEQNTLQSKIWNPIYCYFLVTIPPEFCICYYVCNYCAYFITLPGFCAHFYDLLRFTMLLLCTLLLFVTMLLCLLLLCTLLLLHLGFVHMQLDQNEHNREEFHIWNYWKYSHQYLFSRS